VLIFGGLALSLQIFMQLREHFRLVGIRPFLVATIISVPLGVVFLARVDSQLFARFLGLLLIVSALQRSVPHLARHRWHPVYLGIPAGLLTGSLTGAFGTPGPSAIAFMVTQQFDRFRFSATLQGVFLLAALIRLVSLIVSGEMTLHLTLLSLIGILGALSGGFIGMFFLSRMSKRVSSLLVVILLFALGMWFLVSG